MICLQNRGGKFGCLWTSKQCRIHQFLLRGAGQWISGKIPPEENYYYMRAKTFTDAVFTAVYTVGAAASAAEAARALDTAGLSESMAFATAPTGGGGVTFGSVAVAELAESAVMSGVSFVSARMADRSQGIFRAHVR